MQLTFRGWLFTFGGWPYHWRRVFNNSWEYHVNIGQSLFIQKCTAPVGRICFAHLTFFLQVLTAEPQYTTTAEEAWSACQVPMFACDLHLYLTAVGTICPHLMRWLSSGPAQLQHNHATLSWDIGIGQATWKARAREEIEEWGWRYGQSGFRASSYTLALCLWPHSGLTTIWMNPMPFCMEVACSPALSSTYLPLWISSSSRTSHITWTGSVLPGRCKHGWPHQPQHWPVGFFAFTIHWTGPKSRMSYQKVRRHMTDQI